MGDTREITLDNVSKALLEGMQADERQGGNIQLKFSTLKGKSAFDICEAMLAQKTALIEAGFTEDQIRGQLSFRNEKLSAAAGEAVWTPNPTIWVNHPRPQDVAVAETKAELAQVKAQLSNMEANMAGVVQQAIAAALAGAAGATPTTGKVVEVESENPL